MSRPNCHPHADQVRFWRSKGGAEVDFVVRRGDRLVAIEVKAARRPVRKSPAAPGASSKPTARRASPSSTAVSGARRRSPRCRPNFAARGSSARCSRSLKSPRADLRCRVSTRSWQQRSFSPGQRPGTTELTPPDPATPPLRQTSARPSPRSSRRRLPAGSFSPPASPSARRRRRGNRPRDRGRPPNPSSPGRP